MTSWFDHFDSNGDGRISFEEFLDALGNQPTCTANEWHAFFRVLDIDDNGKVTIHEMSNTLESLGYVFSDEVIEDFFIEFDEQGNGYLELKDIQNMASKLLSRINQ